jgi:hypothetical protein
MQQQKYEKMEHQLSTMMETLQKQMSQQQAAPTQDFSQSADFA